MSVTAIDRGRTKTEVTEETLVRRIHEYGPRWKDRTAETDKLRRLPDETMAELHEIGVLKQFQPKAHSGYAMDWGSIIRVGAEIARYCPSTAWIHSIVGLHAWIAGRFPHEAQSEIFAGQDVLIATAFAGGRDVDVTPEKGGYRINGQWRFSSGVTQSEWAIVGAQPRAGTLKQYEFTLFALPQSDFTYNDIWHTSGLRGTGSNDIIIKDAFVPKHRSIVMSSLHNSPNPKDNPHEDYIFHVELQPYFGTNLLGPLIGTAKGAFEAYVETTRKRVGQMFGEKVAEQAPVHIRIGESAAEIYALEGLANKIIDVLHSAGTERRRVTRAERVDIKISMSLASRLALSAIERLINVMGAAGVTNDNPVQHYFNDLRAVAAHQGFAWDQNMAPYGRWALGMSVGQAALDAAPSGRAELFD